MDIPNTEGNRYASVNHFWIGELEAPSRLQSHRSCMWEPSGPESAGMWVHATQALIAVDRPCVSRMLKEASWSR